MTSRRLRAGAVLLALAALTTACSTTRPETGAAASDGDLASPGVTADTVKVGYPVFDASKLRAQLGFKGVEGGGAEVGQKAVNAIVAYVNSHGGMGGRTLEPVIRVVTPSTTSNVTGESECRAFTQDNSIFAIVGGTGFENNVRPCYRAARTIMMDVTAIAHDQKEFETYSPYLWAPTQPEFGGFVRAQIASMASTGWFANSKGVAVVVPDSEVTRRAGADVVVPAIKALGINNVPVYTIDSSNVGTLGTTTSNALAGIKSTGVDRVFVAGGARILAVMVADVKAEGLPVKYSMSTLDLPSFFVDNGGFIVDNVRNGMAGMGYTRGLDERRTTAPFPDPASPTEVLCKGIIDAAGAQPPEPYRENYGSSFTYCDVTLTLKAALDSVPKPAQITPNAFRDGMWKIGKSLQLTSNTATDWSTGRYAGGAAARPMAWNPTCVVQGTTEPGCFEYTGPATPLAVVP